MQPRLNEYTPTNLFTNKARTCKGATYSKRRPPSLILGRLVQHSHTGIIFASHRRRLASSPTAKSTCWETIGVVA
ncbi:hypothetical protein ACCO45_005274 [Purpureocillium lilacinum]|uniref:Uncharacterized protein n=1 Tax=Purpureocillium lilacinum TaxID=33203 RepID=A0ACC4DUY2_PURLI